MTKASKFIVLLAVITVVGGCSSIPYGKRVADRQAAYDAAAGAPIRSFHFFQPFWSWESLGTDQVAVYTRPHEAYLLDVPGCTELPFAAAIGVTSSLNEVHARFDRVLTGREFAPCIITQIRPIDVTHLKAVQEKQRRIDAEPRQGKGKSPAS